MIEPHDIVALEYECRNCHSRYAIRLDSQSKAQVNCPGCGAQWVRTEHLGGPDPKDIAIPEFILALNKLKAAAKESILRLEITPPEESSSRVPAA
jgi:DNA-directed RNA polymerase subunit RPC12/RpoP